MTSEATSSTIIESFLLDENHPVNFDQADGEDVVSTTSSIDSSTCSMTSEATPSNFVSSTGGMYVHSFLASSSAKRITSPHK